MAGAFGDHQLQLPYEPVTDLLAKYARRDPAKTAIVDLDSGTSISFGQLDRIAIDIAADLKRRGVRKGRRILLLSDGNLEMLLIWLGAWRLGAYSHLHAGVAGWCLGVVRATAAASTQQHKDRGRDDGGVQSNDVHGKDPRVSVE